MMAEAAGLLAHASQAGQLGRYQLEAAIQSVHAHRADSGDTDWHAIALLYRGLLAQSPTLGYQLGFISVLEHLEGAEVAWEHLSALQHQFAQRLPSGAVIQSDGRLAIAP